MLREPETPREGLPSQQDLPRDRDAVCLLIAVNVQRWGLSGVTARGRVGRSWGRLSAWPSCVRAGFGQRAGAGPLQCAHVAQGHGLRLPQCTGWATVPQPIAHTGKSPGTVPPASPGPPSRCRPCIRFKLPAPGGSQALRTQVPRTALLSPWASTSSLTHLCFGK